jgi:hypothetical protein
MTAPNNSIIADSTKLEFNVTDNFGLYKIWFVRDGNATEVDPAFLIDVSSWPDGPSEFAVRAEDTVHNQAEQTYQIIVDRTSPTVELVSPADNDESDVHVNFTYTVLDDYDNEMDCRVYIDDEGKEQHVAEDEKTWPTLLAIGEHLWKVQCVDDAGNSGESDERQILVVDLTGPDIAMNNPDTVVRGDPVEISLAVTDVSGVDAVNAELKGPDGHSQTVPLENDGSGYTASVETTSDTVTGAYTLEVYAIDTLNHSSYASDIVSITYNVVVALEVEPATALPGEDVVVTGVIVYDNGSSVPEEAGVLEFPGGTEEIDLEEGEFSHAFSAPSADGVYDVVFSVSAGNGVEYTGLKKFSVVAPYTPSVSSSGGGAGQGTYKQRTEQESCGSDWSCTAWTTCDEGEQKRVCVDLNKCSDETRLTEKRTCTPVEEESDDGTGQGNAVSAHREPLPTTEEHTVDTTEEDQGDAAGIGKASGFMSALDVSMVNVLFALLLMTVLMGTLYKFGWSKGDNRRKPAAVDYLSSRGGDKLGLDSYLNKRAGRRGGF